MALKLSPHLEKQPIMLNTCSNPIRIAITDDQDMVREGFCSILSPNKRFHIDINARNEEECMARIAKAPTLPDVCILAVNDHPRRSWEAVVKLKQKWPLIKVLVMTHSLCEEYVGKAIRTGANGYLTKDLSANNLVEAIIKVHETDVYFPECVIRPMYRQLRSERKDRLSERELEFLSHCASDASYKEIAQIMAVSPRTVEGYRNSLFEKLKTKTRVGLAMYAARAGIVSIFE